MFTLNTESVKRERFTDFASTDLFARHLLKWDDGSERVVYEVGEIRRLTSYLYYLEENLKGVARGNEPAFESFTRGGRTRYPMSAASRQLWCSFMCITDAPKEICSNRRLNPWLRLGLHLIEKWGPRLRCYIVNGVLDLSTEYPRRILSHIVYVIRRVSKAALFQKQLARDCRRARDNYVSCCEYLLDVLAEDARPLVLRFDLYFEGDAKAISDSGAARKAIDKFIRNMREGRIVSHVIAYIAVREDGLDRRIHYHVMCWLDGNGHRNAHVLGELFGKDWVYNCVGSKALGAYKNCWERRLEYENCCLGLMHYTDEAMLKGLRDALAYMCKLTEQPHVYVEKGLGKNLRKGQSPRRRPGRKKPGAPRKQGNDISLARGILLGEMTGPSARD